VNLLRQVNTSLFCLVAAVFVQAYSHIQANILQFAHRLDMAHLPLLTLLYHRYHNWGYLLPALAFAVFLLTAGRQDRQALQYAFSSAIAQAALLWSLTALLAWQLPLYYPVSTIE
jgi:hypothetical protein